jgi:hypothetical protein
VSAFKPGDRVLVAVTVERVEAAEYFVRVDAPDGRFYHYYVPSTSVRPAPEPPYVDPELVPGMVVMSEDRSDDRHWHYLPEDEADTRSFYGRDEDGDYVWYIRDALPDEIRPVFDPREVTT